MTKIKITTTQNIDIEYELATLYDRILAWWIDFAILVAYALIARLVLVILLDDVDYFGYLTSATSLSDRRV